MDLTASPAPRLGPRVLLVDDHETGLELMRLLLEMAGYRCLTARSGAEALDRCAEAAPEVVVTDLCMPDGDGRLLGRWFRACYPAVPLVLITAEDPESEQVESSRPVFDTVLSKPIDPDRLLEVLECSLAAAPATSVP